MNQGFRPGFGRPGFGRPGFGRPGWNNQGGFWGPFLLGGITGGLISPIFYNRPNYYQYPYYGGYYYY